MPLGGFFGNGEIGPVGGHTFLHGYTSAFGLFRPGSVRVDELPLCCLGCRARTERGRELHTLSFDRSGGSDTLVCDNPACRRRYPIVDGVPLVVPDQDAYRQRWGAGIVESTLDLDEQMRLAAAGPDDAPQARLAEQLSIYLDTQWGDRATPPPDGPGGRFGMEAMAQRARRARFRAGRARGRARLRRRSRALRAGARRAVVVGVDLQLASLRRAARLLAGEPLDYARRIAGRNYARAHLAPPPPSPSTSWALVCADAMDPPLVPGSFDRVVALNVLDAVAAPSQIVAVADGLCAPGGELILASPYAWQSGIVAEEQRFGDADPAAELRRRLVEGAALEARYTRRGRSRAAVDAAP